MQLDPLAHISTTHSGNVDRLTKANMLVMRAAYALSLPPGETKDGLLSALQKELDGWAKSEYAKPLHLTLHLWTPS